MEPTVTTNKLRRINGGKSVPIITPVVTSDPDLVSAIRGLEQTVAMTNTHLASLATDTSEIAYIFGSFKRFGKKWLPWIIAVAGIAYPPIAKWIATLPPIPH